MRLLRPLGVVALGLGLLGCGQATEPGASPPAQEETARGTWERLPDPPLTPRAIGVAATVADRVVVVGGDQGPGCPPGADCVDRSDHAVDGAAYDDASGSWEAIADAPAPVTEYAAHATVGDVLHVVGKDGDLLSYDARADRWTVRELPGDGTWYSLAAAGDRLLAFPGSNEAEGRDLPDLVLDEDGWQELPAHPLGPLFDRRLVGAGEDVVLVGRRLLPGDGVEDPALLTAAVLDEGAWTALPTGDLLGGSGFAWTGERLVDPTTGGSDGGETNGYGEVLPYGGTLDPDSLAWGRLPDVPDELTGGWPAYTLEAAGPLVARDGWLYDDDRRTWARLARPDGGPEQPGPATWLGSDLVVVGGQREPADPDVGAWTARAVHDTGAWVLRR